VKLFSFSRKAILRAIHAACVALYLFAAQREAAAQSYTAPFQVSGSTVTTASGSYGTGSGFYDSTNTYTSFTVGAGTTINSTTAYAGSGSGYPNPSALITADASTFSNSGTLTLSGTYGSGSGVYQAVVFLNEGATSLTATNSGSITGSLAGGNSGGSVDYAIEVNSTTGDISITNSGSLSLASGTYFGDDIFAYSASGNVTVTNTGSGTITSGTLEHADGVVVNTSGTVTFSNAGTISGTSMQNGANLTSGSTIQATNSGLIDTNFQGIFALAPSVNVNNSGMITGSSYAGIYASGNNVSVTNSGTISNSGYAIDVSGTGPINVVNSGTITSSAYGIKVGSAGAGSAITLTNSGSITATNSGIYSVAIANVINSGNITAPAAINVPSGSTVTLAGRPIISGTIVGGATSASTSQLVFNLSISAANLSAATAQLNTEIAAYAAQDGGSYTFTVDGLTFDVSNFDYNNIEDDIAQPPAARVYANTPGFQSEGTVLDNLPSGNAVAARILTALGNVPDAGVAAALGELSPKELQVFRNVAFDNNTFNDQQVNNHLANLRDGLTGFDSSALTIQDSSMDPTLNQVRDHLLAYNPAATPGLISDSADSLLGAFDAKDMKSAQVNTMPVDRWSSFIAGNVILADLSNNANVPDSNYTTGNVSAGLDYRLDEHFTVGALFAYAHTDANLDDRGSSATVDSYSPGIYASYVDGPWYGNFLGAYTRNSYTEDREIDINGLGGDNHGGSNGNQGSANLTGGYEFQQGAFKFGPVASMQYVHLAIGSIQEQGPTALDINDQNQDSLRSLVGFEGRFNARAGAVSLTPHVSASWQHEYMDNGGGITSQFDGAGGGSFVTQTDRPDRDSAFVDVGLDATVSKNVTVFVDYETQAGQSNFFAQSAQGGVRIGF
jgi:outer membrane autotransporter protein